MVVLKLLKNNFKLVLVLLVATVLFGYKLSSIPSGIYVDEAVVGYEAWSILQTGRDHFGQFLPIYFKFFGSFTPGLFVYVESLFVFLFGLSPEAIRLPSLISMLIIVLAIYKFLKDEKLVINKNNIWILMLFLVIMPWVVFNARLGYETTFACMLWVIGVLNYKNPLVSLVFISLSTYASHTQRYLAPLTILVLYFIFYFGKKITKKIGTGLVLAILIQIPNLILLTTPAFFVKNSSMTNLFVSQYLSYFSPINLFYKTDYDLQRSIPHMAIFYSWMIIPWIIGLLKFVSQRQIPSHKLVIVLCLIAPIPAALANTNYSTQRALPLLLPYSIFILVGIDIIFNKFNKYLKWFVSGLLLILSLILLLRSYFILFPKQRCEAWNCGYNEIANSISSNPDKHFVIDNSRVHADILMLFWLKYPPLLYQQQNHYQGNYYENLQDVTNISFDNVEVRPINWKEDICKNQIIVGDGLAISKDQVKEHMLTNVLTINNNLQKIILQAYQTDPIAKCGLGKIIK